MTATAIDLKGICKAYQPGKRVLEPIDLSIQPGELFFLLGPSGCGKSTLLRILAGLIAPDEGEIFFNAARIDQLPPEKRQAAMVFQSYALWPHLSVFENVAFGLRASGVKGAELNRRVAEALEIVQLGELRDRKIPSLSGGQQQRVALARALAVEPAVLLLDEPLSNLDARLRDIMRLEIRRICKERRQTAIYVTHDRKEALSMADRIAVLNQGKLQQIGTPQEIYRQPCNRFVGAFLGEANFIPATITAVTAVRIRVACGWGELSAPSPAKPLAAGDCVELLIRPESIRPAADEELENSFEAVLTEGTFLGESGSWSLKAGDGSRLVMNELSPRPRLPGDTLRVQVAPEDIVILEAER